MSSIFVCNTNLALPSDYLNHSAGRRVTKQVSTCNTVFNKRLQDLCSLCFTRILLPWYSVISLLEPTVPQLTKCNFLLNLFECILGLSKITKINFKSHCSTYFKNQLNRSFFLLSLLEEINLYFLTILIFEVQKIYVF